MPYTEKSASAIYKSWVQQRVRISRRNARLLISAWFLLRDHGELPKEWEDVDGSGAGALAMFRDVGKPGRARRDLQRQDSTKPHGPGNTCWGSNGLTSNDPGYQKAYHAWVATRTKDAGFRQTFKNFGLLLSLLGAPPTFNAREHRLGFEKAKPERLWGMDNVRYCLLDLGGERTTRETVALVRQRAYAAYRRAPQGTWDTFEIFLADVGLPPAQSVNERWALVPKDPNRYLAVGNARWLRKGVRGQHRNTDVVPLLVLNEKHCLQITKMIQGVNPRLTQLEAWEIATALRNRRFSDAALDAENRAADGEAARENLTTSEATSTEQDQGQPPAPALCGASGDASPGSAVGPSPTGNPRSADLIAALSFLSSVADLEDPDLVLLSSSKFLLSSKDTEPSVAEEALGVLRKYRSAIRAARQM